MAKQKQIGKSLSSECMKIAMRQVGDIEGWLKRVSQQNPKAAVELWLKIAEFGEPQGKDSKPQTNIQINFSPAKKSQDVIDITPNPENE